MIVRYEEMVFNYTLHFLSNNLRCNNTDHSLTFQIFQLQEAKAKGVKKGVFHDFIVQARSRKDGKPVSQKAAKHIKKVAKAQATVEARATPDSQEGESVTPSPFAEVAAIHAEIGTPDRAGRVPGLGFEARPT